MSIIRFLVTSSTWEKICAELNNLNSPFSEQELTENERGVDYKRNTMGSGFL